MSTGVWRCVPADEPGYPRGLHQSARPDDGGPAVLTRRARLPYKHATVIRRDGSGDRTDTDYVLSATPDGPRLLITGRHVQTGEWARKLGIPLSADPKIMQAAGTAIFLMPSADPDEREAVPRCGPDGKVAIPAPETLPPGYLRTGPLPEDQALAMWRELVTPVAVSNPKFALYLGGSAISPWVGWLDHSEVMAFFVDAWGAKDCGKSTMQRTAGSIWGHSPKTGGVVRSWNMSKQAPGRYLGMLGILPGLLEEQGAAGFGADQWGHVIYGITDGTRGAANRDDGMRITLPFTGTVLSTGNAPITDELGYGATHGIGPKRVITLAGPFTASAVQAESVKPVWREAYGYPGRAILAGFDGARVLALLADAVRLVGLPDGHARSASKNLHLLVTGAAMLDQVLGTGTVIRDSAVTGAREFLAANSHEPEHDADRLLGLIRESIAGSPAKWPTQSECRELRLPRPQWTDGGIEPGRIELPQHGFNASDFSGVLADDGSWFAIRHTALGELLTRTGARLSIALAEADKRGWLNVPPAKRRKRELTTDIKHFGPAHKFDLPIVADDEDQDVSPDPASGPPAPEPPATPEPGRCPGCQAMRPLHAADCPDLIPMPPEPEPDEPDERDRQDHEPAMTGPAVSPPAEAEPGPEPPPEPTGHDGTPEPASAATALSEPPAGPDRTTGPCRRCGQPTRVYGPGGRPLCDRCQPGTATPAEPIIEPAPVRRKVADLSTADELAAFGRALRKRHEDATDTDLAAALAIFHAATSGVRWIDSYAGQEGQAWFSMLAARHPSMTRPVPLASMHAHEIAGTGPRVHVNYAVKPRGKISAAGKYVTSYDINGQFAAALSSVKLGDGEPDVIMSPRDMTALVTYPGYVRFGHAVKTGHPALGTIEAGEWVAMPLVEYLTSTRDHGLTIPAGAIAEVVYWPEHGRRLSVYAARYRDARDKLMSATQSEPVILALAALKDQANAFVGMFRSKTHSHGGWYRPDWNDMVVATAGANALRGIAKCEIQPVAKQADSAYWITTGTEPVTPAGLVISGQLGKWKLDRHGPVDAELIDALRAGSSTGVRDAVIRIYSEVRP